MPPIPPIPHLGVVGQNTFSMGEGRELCPVGPGGSEVSIESGNWEFWKLWVVEAFPEASR